MSIYVYRLYGVVSRRTVILIASAVKTSELTTATATHMFILKFRKFQFNIPLRDLSFCRSVHKDSSLLSCDTINSYRRFGGASYLHLQDSLEE